MTATIAKKLITFHCRHCPVQYRPWRTYDVPFSGKAVASSVEIYHGAHGKYETRSPIRTFLAMEIAGEPNIVASYTCTPLVTIPVKQIVSKVKIKGRTVAELGNRNRPLDMIQYSKDGKHYILMANSARGVMKVELASITQVTPITDRIADTAGLPYETLTELQGVQQLDRFDDSRALLLVEDSSGLNLQTIDLP